MAQLKIVVMSSAEDVDDILQRTPKEIEHNKALEAGIVFEEQLDRLINSASKRRNDALQQLEVYRQGLWRYWREASDKIIDAEVAEIAEQPKEVEPMVPNSGSENSQPISSNDASPVFERPASGSATTSESP
jgi:predicted DNA-binding protein (UPF0251 family)